MRFIERFIPEPFRTDRKIRDSARLILRIDLLILAFSLILIPVFNLIHFQYGAYVMVFSALCAFIYPILFYYSQNFPLSGNFFAIASLSVFSALILLSGSLHSPFLIWLITIPPVCLFYLKRPYSWLWVAVVVLIMVGMGTLEIMEYRMLNYLQSQYHPFVVLISFSLVAMILGSVARTFLRVYRKVNQKLKQSNESLTSSNLELERFAYIASHDLKSPLRNIASFANLLDRRCGDDLNANGRDYLQLILTNARQMHHLVEDILEYSKTTNKEIKKGRN